MVRLHPHSDGSRIAQELYSPCVYLDHCAFRRISESDYLSDQFSRALLLRRGTLALSWLNFVEFSKVTDKGQRQMAAHLLSKIGPNVFWLNPDFFSVAKRENLHVGNKGLPVADMEMAIVYLRAVHDSNRQGSTAPFIKLFDAVINGESIRKQFDDLGKDIVSKFQWLRDDDSISAELRKPVRLDKRPHYGTKVIARELIARIIKCKEIKLTHNNAIDLTHSVVPASYCDFVILDKQWATWINQLKSRLNILGVTIPIATGIPVGKSESFLKQLEYDISA